MADIAITTTSPAPIKKLKKSDKDVLRKKPIRTKGK